MFLVPDSIIFQLDNSLFLFLEVVRIFISTMEAPSNIRTKAYVVHREGDPFTLCDVVLDEVRPNEVLVEIWYTGICHTVSIPAHFTAFSFC